jgi:spermidine synthase
MLFFGSGLCALAYETVWVRQLVFAYGISVYAVSAVLAAYMFGLSVGAYLIGRRTRRIRNPLRVYAWFEICIVGYNCALYFVLKDLLPYLYSVGYGFLTDAPAALNLARFLATFLLLAVPTGLMGGTLPVLASLLRHGEGRVGSSIGWLYGINTLGGVAGTALAGFWLLGDLGIFRTTLVTLALNLIIAFAALLFSRRTALHRAPSATVAPAPVVTRERRPGTALVSLTLLISGYTALSYEVLWNRSLLLYTHNSTYAFSSILMVFLLGTGLGSLLFASFSERLTGRRQLGLVQLLLGASVWISIPLTGELPRVLRALTHVTGADSWAAALSTIAVSAVSVVFVPTLLMGMTFPIATALLASSRDEIGEVTGRAYAYLTVGNILGPVLTGFFLIEWVGLRNAFGIGIFCNLLLAFALLVFRRGLWPWVVAGAFAAGAMAIFVNTVERDIFRSYYEEFVGKILFYKEEVADNVLVYQREDGSRGIFFSDGRGTAGTGTNLTNRLAGHIPMLLHPDPKSVLSICFGVGNTLSALAQWEPDELVCVELSPGALEAAPFFPTNRGVLDTPNLEVHVDDGRNYLLRSRKTFDVIQLEPPELHQSGVVNLYTRDFYELARSHLTQNGVVCQWFSMLMPDYEQRMVIKAFQDVFPHASLWSGNNLTSLFLVGSVEPLRMRPEEFFERAARPSVREDLRRMRLGPMDVLARHLLGPEALRRYVGDVPAVTDDRTVVDFTIPRSAESGYGVFIYGTYQSFDWEGGVGGVWRRAFRLERRSESPSYLFDFTGIDEASRKVTLEDLEVARVRYHRRVRARYLDLEGKRTGRSPRR